MSSSSRFYSQERDFLGSLQADLRNLRGISTLISELTQNADDVKTEDGKPGASMISFDVRDDMLIVANDGTFNDCQHLDEAECPWRTERGRRCDFHRMRFVAGADKRNEEGTTGAFGIGFNTVYQITDHPELISQGHHLIFRPEQPSAERIEDRSVPVTSGTTFRLPWAYNAETLGRQRLMLPAIQPEDPARFADEIAAILPLVALFLKQIMVMELRRNGHLVKRIQRQPENMDVVINDGERRTRWRFLTSSFNTDALRQKYPQIEAKRSGKVTIAIPHKPLEHGRLFAVLPTETTMPLPFHINADFFPSSDRKRILLGDDRDYQVMWNRTAIRMAAYTLGSHVAELRALLGPVGLWTLAQRAFECSQPATRGQVDIAFQDFWSALKVKLRDQPTVYTVADRWVAPHEARLLESKDEQSAPLLSDLGIPIVHEQLRSFYGLLQNREIGAAVLGIRDIEAVLKQHGLTRPVSLMEAPPALRHRQGWRVFWNALDTLAGSRRTSDSDVQRLANYAIAFDTQENLNLPKNLLRFSSGASELFKGVRWLEPSLSPDYLPGRLVPTLTVYRAIQILNQRTSAELEGSWRNRELDISALYRWFEQHSNDIRRNPQLIEQLRQLSIWPVGERLRSLTGVYIPGDFEDPLKQTHIVNVTALGGRKEFLRDLNVPDLTFATYVRGQLLDVLRDQPALPNHIKQQLIQLLASRYGEFMADGELGRRLGQFAIVECIDGRFRPAAQVYARNEITMALGPKVMLALANDITIATLHQWLGVRDQPHPRDILTSIKDVAIGDRTPEKVATIELFFRYLARHWTQWDENYRDAYRELLTLAWLPGTRLNPAWSYPHQLHSVFEHYLFESQGNFLAFPRALQSESTDFLNFLQIRSTPTIELVIRHLRHSRNQGQPVNLQVYRFLNTHASNPAIDVLKSEQCILLPGGQYVAPWETFRGQHPFGRFRHALGNYLQESYALMESLGVRDVPGESDAVMLLCDLANIFGFTGTTLDDEAFEVILECWKLLSGSIDDLTVADLEGMADLPVVPDGERRLHRPDDVFFEDRVGLAERFLHLRPAQVIPRPQGAWRAMAMAGVRPISQAITPHLVEYGTLVPDDLITHRLRERHALIARVLDPERVRQQVVVDMRVLDEIEVQRASVLLVDYKLPNHLPSQTERVTAFLRHNDSENESATLFYTSPNDIVPWISMARVLAEALLPGGDIGGVAGGLKEVIAQEHAEDAVQILNELGYPTVQHWSTEHISSNIVSAVEEGGEEQLGETSPAVEQEATPPIPNQDSVTSSSSEPQADLTQETPILQVTPESYTEPEADVTVGLLAPQETSESNTELGLNSTSPQDDQAGGQSDSHGIVTTTHPGAVPSTRTESVGHNVDPRAETTSSAGPHPDTASTTPQVVGHDPAPQRLLTPTRAEQLTNGLLPKPVRRVHGKLRTYVTSSEPNTKDDPDSAVAEQRSRVDQAGIRHVLRYEQQHARTPFEMPHHQPGYDVRSIDATGQVRYIEVKSLSNHWSEHYAAGLSRKQWETAREYGAAYWLYVVERATEPDARVYPICNPAGRVNQFLFDDGWIKLAGEENINIVEGDDEAPQ